MSREQVGRNDPCPCGSGKKYKQCCLQNAQAAELRPAALLETARVHHDAGRLQEAARIYEQILQIEPRNPDALHRLGLVAEQFGQSDAAEQLIRLAIEAYPNSPHFYNSLGNILLKKSRFLDAISSYEKVLALDPRHVDALSNAGIALQAMGQLDAAVRCYQKALQENPKHAQGHNNLGNIFLAQGKLEDATACYRRALALNPAYADAYYNLGNVLQRQGRFEEAGATYTEALTCRPDFAEAHNNLGVTLRQRGRQEEAVKSFEQALALRPDYADASNNLGVALQEQGKIKLAIDCYRKLLARHPDYADAHYNLGCALHEDGSLEDAIAGYERALALKPDFLSAYTNLLYLHATTRWISPEAERELAAGWEKAALADFERQTARDRQFQRLPLAGRKLKLGIVSAEIGDHAVAEFLEPILSGLDHSRFDVTLFPTVLRPGPRATRMQALAEAVKPIGEFSDAAAAELIRAENIDVLMDTTGHTRRCRLGIFARRAAPVQLTYVGYWSTTGLTEMDWILADKYLPIEFDAHFRESVWRLPRLAVTYRGDPTLPASGWTPSPDGTIWLGSFNRYLKIREETLRLWSKVMQALPQAKLLLEDRNADDSDAHRRILRILGELGIAAERVEFEPFVPGHERHMRLYDRLDLALDTIPFNSGTTACDALWMGVPLVALEGTWGGGVMASTFLKAIGRPEWVAANPEEYVSIVSKLANDVDLRTRLRATQREQVAKSELCDSAGLTLALQDAFEQMFVRWMESRRG